jgi:hypothetical protein
MTGDIEFNEHGDRIESLYEIINIQRGELTSVGSYRSNTVSSNITYNSLENFFKLNLCLSGVQLVLCFSFRLFAIQVVSVEKL